MELKEMLAADMKKARVTAMKTKDTIERDALRVLISEISLSEDKETETIREKATKAAKKEAIANGEDPTSVGFISVEPVVYGDKEVTALITKSIKNLKTIGSSDSEAEVKVLEKYLPKQISESDLRSEIELIINTNSYDGMKDMGKVMGELKANYDGQYNGGVASGIIKEFLN